MSYHYGQLRFWEMFPGLLVWGTFSLALLLSFVAPLWVIIFIIVFDLLWLFRVLYFNLFVLISWNRYRQARKTDWQQKLASIPDSQRIRHLVLLPTYQEGYEIIRSTLRSLKDNKTPNDRFFVVLGGEEGDKAGFEKIAHRAQQEFGCVFAYFGTTLHPQGLPDEIQGKGSNLNWMGHELEV